MGLAGRISGSVPGGKLWSSVLSFSFGDEQCSIFVFLDLEGKVDIKATEKERNLQEGRWYSAKEKCRRGVRQGLSLS